MEKFKVVKKIQEVEYFDDGFEGIWGEKNETLEIDSCIKDEDINSDDNEESLMGYISNWKKERYGIDVELEDGAKVPQKMYPTEDAGFDLYTPTEVVVKPGEVKTIPLNFKINFSTLSYGQIAPKSGLAAKGLHIMGGVVDSGYEGVVSVVVTNLNWENGPLSLNAGDKIAQLIMHPYSPEYKINKVKKIDKKSKRGVGGFNSTGNC
jgi:dUTP pyrophosphatase